MTSEAETTALLRDLREGKDYEQLAAVRELAERRVVAAVPALIDVIERDGDETLMTVAAEALGQIGDRRAIPALLSILGARPFDSWIRAIKDHDTPAERAGHAAVAIVQLLTEQEALREAAATALGRLGDPEVVPALIAQFRDETEPNHVRVCIVRALGRLAGSQARDFLIDRLGKFIPPIPEHYPRREFEAVIAALERIGDDTACDAIATWRDQHDQSATNV